jgi:2-keto-3-deoxy-6-phosphogluconate aldolase
VRTHGEATAHMSAVIDPGMRHFQALNQPDQIAAIRQLATSGMGDYAIAAATRLSVEQVRSILTGLQESP